MSTRYLADVQLLCQERRCLADEMVYRCYGAYLHAGLPYGFGSIALRLH